MCFYTKNLLNKLFFTFTILALSLCIMPSKIYANSGVEPSSCSCGEEGVVPASACTNSQALAVCRQVVNNSGILPTLNGPMASQYSPKYWYCPNYPLVCNNLDSSLEKWLCGGMAYTQNPQKNYPEIIYFSLTCTENGCTKNKNFQPSTDTARCGNR